MIEPARLAQAQPVASAARSLGRRCVTRAGGAQELRNARENGSAQQIGRAAYLANPFAALAQPVRRPRAARRLFWPIGPAGRTAGWPAGALLRAPPPRDPARGRPGFLALRRRAAGPSRVAKRADSS